MNETVLLDRMARIGSWHDGDGGPLHHLTVHVKVVELLHATPQQTIDHEPIVRYERLTIVGEVLTTRRHIASGQVHADLALITRPAPGWGPDDRARLGEVWARWHLNDLRAACAHQTPPAGRNDPDPAPCPRTGYRYGTAWLVEPLPADVLAWLTARFGGEA